MYIKLRSLNLPIINRKKQKTEKNIIKFIVISQGLRTMGRKKLGAAQSNRKMLKD